MNCGEAGAWCGKQQYTIYTHFLFITRLRWHFRVGYIGVGAKLAARTRTHHPARVIKAFHQRYLFDEPPYR